MPRGVPSSGKKQSITKKAKREFDKWNKEKYPIYDEDGKQLILEDDEIFIPVWDYSRKKKDANGMCFIKVDGQREYKKERYNYRLRPGESYVVEPKFDLCYYVSNYGNVLSFKFHGTDQPLVMKQTAGTNGYMQVGDTWRSHKLVWFSFMANVIELKQRESDAEFPYELPASYGTDLQTLNDLKYLIKLEDTEVHHRDANVKNNRLDNLEVLPADVHDLLTTMKNTEDPEEQWNKLIESDVLHYYDSKASVIVTDNDDTAIIAVDPEELLQHFSPKAMQQLKDMYLSNYVYEILAQVIDVFGYPFFNDKTIFMYIDENNIIASIAVKKIDNKLEVSQILGINVDYDIICQNGSIYFPNYSL